MGRQSHTFVFSGPSSMLSVKSIQQLPFTSYALIKQRGQTVHAVGQQH